MNHLRTEIFIFFILSIAILMLYVFIKSRNGLLRKIMIAYFIMEIILWGSALIYIILGYSAGFILSPYVFWVILVPKAVLKSWFLYYFKTKK